MTRRTHLPSLAVVTLLIALALPVNTTADLIIEGDRGTMAFEGRVRLLYVDEIQADGDSSRADDRFQVQSARMGIHGDYLADLSYEMEWELRAWADGGDDPIVEAKDLKVMWRPRREFKLYAGQMKVPFSRNRGISIKKVLTTSRPPLTGKFTPGRDIGLMTRVRSRNEKYELRVGVFTGAGANRKNDDERGSKLWAARFEGMPLGLAAKSEGDAENTPSARILVGASIAHSHDAMIPGDSPEYLRTIVGKKTAFGFDGTFKYRGLFLNYELVRAELEPDVGSRFDAGGFLVQASWFYDRLKVEPRVGYDQFNPNSGVRGNTEETFTMGLNFVPLGRLIKIMAEHVDRLPLDATDEDWKEDEVRILFQLVVN